VQSGAGQQRQDLQAQQQQQQQQQGQSEEAQPQHGPVRPVRLRTPSRRLAEATIETESQRDQRDTARQIRDIIKKDSFWDNLQ